MFKRIWYFARIGAFVAIGVFAALLYSQAQAQTCAAGAACVYSVKFICGDEPVPNPTPKPPAEPPVKPGNYTTSINIHNFHLDQRAVFTKTAVIAPTEADFEKNPNQIQSSKVVSITLLPGQPIEIDCSDIVNLFGTLPPSSGPFIKGFVELRGSFPTLSVTAVYTAQAAIAGTAPSGPVSIEVVPVQPFLGP
jgi:hypothetical protein